MSESRDEDSSEKAIRREIMTDRQTEVVLDRGCPALAHLDLSNNKIGAARAKSLAGVLGQCRALTNLILWNNTIGDSGAESLSGVLA